MRTLYNSALTKADCKLAARWTITAAAVYGVILVGLLALLLTSTGTYADPDNPADHVSFCDIDGIAAPASDTMRATELQSSGVAETDGFESRWMPAAANAANSAGAAEPAKPEEALVENGWDFTVPDSVPGFGSLPQAAAAPAAVPTTDGRKVTAQTQK